MDLMEIGLEGVNWIHLAQDRDWWKAFLNMVINLQVPLKVGTLLTICDYIKQAVTDKQQWVVIQLGG
jgi:hypothetical protein